MDIDDGTTKGNTNKSTSNPVNGTTTTTTSVFYTANGNTNLYPSLNSDIFVTSQSHKTADQQHLEGSRKRHSDGSSVFGDKKLKTPTTTPQHSQSWFSHILRK